MATRILEKKSLKVTLHEELMVRAIAAQDTVFADVSVDEYLLLESLKKLNDRLVAQMEAVVGVLKAKGL